MYNLGPWALSKPIFFISPKKCHLKHLEDQKWYISKLQAQKLDKKL